jgi:hypothetical protein
MINLGATNDLGHGAWAAAGIEPLPDWRVALRRAFPDLLAAQAGCGAAPAAAFTLRKPTPGPARL